MTDWSCYLNVKKKTALGKMDSENTDPVVETSGNDVTDSDNINSEERAEQSEVIKSASYWEEVDQDEMERERM